MLKIVKKKELISGKAKLLKLVSLLMALAAGAVVIFALGYDPSKIYGEIIVGSLGSAYAIKETIRTVIPLVIMALGVTICFKLKFISIGAEGQFYMGAMAATYVALNFSFLPIFILLPFMFVVSVAAGGIWCLIPALLKLKTGTNETLVTLMMNYIAIKLVAYLQYGPWKDPQSGGFPSIATFTENAIIPNVFGIHGGWLLALVLVAVIHILLSKTEFGYQISVIGENLKTAKYAGFSTTGLFILAIIIGGGLCGVAGMIQASAVENTLSYQLANGLGFTAIIVAWLGHLKPVPVLFVSLLMAILLQGCAYIQISLQVPAAMAYIIQGVILFFVLGSDFFTIYKFTGRTKKPEVVSL